MLPALVLFLLEGSADQSWSLYMHVKLTVLRFVSSHASLPLRRFFLTAYSQHIVRRTHGGPVWDPRFGGFWVDQDFHSVLISLANKESAGIIAYVHETGCCMGTPLLSYELLQSWKCQLLAHGYKVSIITLDYGRFLFTTNSGRSGARRPAPKVAPEPCVSIRMFSSACV